MVERNEVSLATAKGVPVFLSLIIGYASYVITGPLAVEYLFNPPGGLQPRYTAGIVILVVYYILLVPVIATWLRLLLVVFIDPGFIAIGLPRKDAEPEPAPGMEQFWAKEVFTCNSQGLPIWCSHCNNWKPDRTHHNQDTGRCTLKMDHFCPWVGGVVGERSFKFFVQFLFYSGILSAYGMSVLAYFVAEKREGITLEIQWLIALGLAGFFTLFTVGMVGNCLWLASKNFTTIENIDYRSRTSFLAVLLPPHSQEDTRSGQTSLPAASRDIPLASPSPLTSNGAPPALEHNNQRPSPTSYTSKNTRPVRKNSTLPLRHRIWRGTVTFPLHLPSDRPPLPAPQPRTFAILESLPGMNVWDLGSPWRNLQAVFGSQPYDWLLPIKHSPCCDHSSQISTYPLGPDFEDLLIEVGLLSRPATVAPRDDAESVRSAARRRRRRRRLEPGWQDGERPEGWVSGKQAKSVRNESRRAATEIPDQGVT